MQKTAITYMPKFNRIQSFADENSTRSSRQNWNSHVIFQAGLVNPTMSAKKHILRAIEYV